MKKNEKVKSQFAVCINNSEYPASLELHKIYRVLPDDDATANGDMRVIDESGEDYLFPVACFIPVEVPFALEQAMLKTAYNDMKAY